MKIKFNINLKKCDLNVSNIILSEITYEGRTYQNEAIFNIAIVEVLGGNFKYEIYVVDKEKWINICNFSRKKRLKELTKVFEKYENDIELERKIRKILNEKKIEEIK